MNRILPILLAAFLASCATTQPQLVAFATSTGTGDARTNGDALVVVGDVSCTLGVRTAEGFPLFLVPALPLPLDGGYWYARSSSQGYDERHPVGDPLPWWARALYTPADLVALGDLGFHLTFEDPPVSAP